MCSAPNQIKSRAEPCTIFTLSDSDIACEKVISKTEKSINILLINFKINTPCLNVLK